MSETPMMQAKMMGHGDVTNKKRKGILPDRYGNPIRVSGFY
jgi:hypothetical protein